MDLRPVQPDAREELLDFRCAKKDLDFTLEVEQTIRNDLADSLERGTVEALGSWDNDRLVAVIAYRPGEWVWRVTVLATHRDYGGRKQALRLKRQIVAMAAAAGASAVVSKIHEDNRPMITLNREKFDNVAFERDPDDPNNPYLLCTIPTTQRSSL